ncbi:hypothetical protein MASR1M32_18980 [Rhodobacter sp.]
MALQPAALFPLSPGGAFGPSAYPVEGMTDLTAAPRFGIKGAGVSDWITAQGMALPAVNRWLPVDAGRLLRLGREEVVMLAEDRAAELRSLRDGWDSATGPRGHAAWREEGWARLRLDALRHARTMAALCAVDLRQGRFGADAIAQTRIAGIEGIVLRSGDGRAFDLLFDITVTGHVVDAIGILSQGPQREPLR